MLQDCACHGRDWASLGTKPLKMRPHAHELDIHSPSRKGMGGGRHSRTVDLLRECPTAKGHEQCPVSPRARLSGEYIPTRVERQHTSFLSPHGSAIASKVALSIQSSCIMPTSVLRRGDATRVGAIIHQTMGQHTHLSCSSQWSTMVPTALTPTRW